MNTIQLEFFWNQVLGVFLLFSFTCLISVKKGKISVSALHMLSAADANESGY